MALWEPDYLAEMVTWINNPSTPMYGRWAHAAQGEGGVDLVSAPGTPVYALGDGPLLGAGTFGMVGGFTYSESSSFGVVSQRIQVPGYGLNDIYYQHINIDPSIKFCNNPNGSCNGQYIKRGQQIGTTGGFGEVEIGFNADWGGVWGTNHPASWVTDPRPLIAALMNAAPPPVTSGTGTGASLIASAANLGVLVQKVHIAPDDTVAQLFQAIDVALELKNPFIVSIDTTATDITIPIFNIDTGIPNPVSDTRAVFEGFEEVMSNIVNDLSAGIIRGTFILLGLGVLYGMFQYANSISVSKGLDQVGGVQGVMKIAGLFA